MALAPARIADRAIENTRLAPRIALVLLVKIIGLVVIWALFVRDQRVAVDAHGTAAAFGLVGAQVASKVQPEGHVRGQ